MSLPKSVVLLVCALLFSFLISAQNTCKVIDIDPNGIYSGACINGLAHGKGTYTFGKGSYVYVGSFKEGQMDGDGEMFTVVEGKRISVKKGVWNENIFLEDSSAPYVITLATHLDRYRVVKLGEGNQVRLNFQANGKFYEPGGLDMNASSGSEITRQFKGFEDVVFPLDLRLNFTAPTKLLGGGSRVDFKITINEPGIWLITFVN